MPPQRQGGAATRLLRAVTNQEPEPAPEPAQEPLPDPPPADRWVTDVLGRGHEARTLPLGQDSEGRVDATLVRYNPALDPARAVALRALNAPRFAVLYLHGWSDYLLNPEIGPFWASQDAVFYGLDLRKYGRSLREYQTPGYVDDLATYDEDLAAALAQISYDYPDLPVVLMAHSTGGLTGVLWAHRHPGRLAGLVLIAPWLETQGSSVARGMATPIVSEVARAFPKRALPNPDLGFYHRMVSNESEGEWNVIERWRPRHSFTPRYGWANAILHAHAQVAAGLEVQEPVLVVRSARTMISPVWDPEMSKSDVVVDVSVIAERALRIARTVTVVTIKDAMHDVLLSPHPIRDEAYAEIRRWADGYLPH